MKCLRSFELKTLKNRDEIYEFLPIKENSKPNSLLILEVL